MKRLCVAAGFVAAVVMVGQPTKAEAASGVDGFVWFTRAPNYLQARGATIEIVNTKTGRVVWRGAANGFNPSFPGLGNYYRTGPLPDGQYSARAYYSNGSGQTCCARLNGSSFGGTYSRQNVNVR